VTGPGTLVQVDGRADTEADERSLVERARTDPSAFAELYRRYLPRVHAFVFRRTGIAEVAEDVTSAAFERALRNLGSFRWQAGGFGPWLFRIVANELADHYRRGARAASPRMAGAAGHLHAEVPRDPAEELDARDSVIELLAAMDTLNPRYQRALELRFLAGLTPDEAAAALGTSKATLAVVVHRALRALRRALEEQEARS
jgi:RNA polymerase sigma-70 factor (ECF subfamily)